MLNIVGNAKVTNLKEVGKMLVGTLVSFEKDAKGEFIPTFLNAKFVGKAKDTIMAEGVMDKDKITVTSAIIGTRIWTSKEGISQRDIQVTVFELQRNDDEPAIPKSKFKK